MLYQAPAAKNNTFSFSFLFYSIKPNRVPQLLQPAIAIASSKLTPQ
jgi:hypothetical protein